MEHINDFWKQAWELRKQIFGFPTVEDLCEAYEQGILPKQEAYVCRHTLGHPFKAAIWIPYTELEPMKLANDVYQIRLVAAMWGVKPESIILRNKKLNQEDYI